MTPKKQLPRSFVPLAIVVSAIILYGCGGGSAGPNPTPTATPAPTASLLETVSFDISEGQLGFAAISTFTVPIGGNINNAKAGTFKFVAKWAPAPPTGQLYLLVVRDLNDRTSCYNNLNCPQILVKDVSDGTPKQVQIHLDKTERVYFWTRPVTGRVQGSVEVWFTPDN
jgi:hypothetical protein